MTRMEKNVRFDEDGALEKTLAELVPRPAPPGLKGRILASADEVKERVVMTPRMWSVAAACLVLIAAVLVGDAIISRSQMDEIFALVGRPSAPAPPAQDLSSVLAELGAAGVGMEVRAGERSFLTRSLLDRMGTDSASHASIPEFSKKLEGWNDDEGTENPY